MKIGYARTSTVEQKAGLEAQIRDLTAEGVEKVFSEQLSSVDARRAELEAAIEFAREGDALVVTKLDRLARSVANLVEIEARLAVRGVALLILNPRLSTCTPAEKLTFNIFGAVAQFEREIMLERQREGIAKAKADGKYKGRQPTAMARAGEVKTLLAEGVSKAEIARRLKISERSVYRIAGAAA